MRPALLRATMVIRCKPDCRAGRLTTTGPRPNVKVPELTRRPPRVMRMLAEQAPAVRKWTRTIHPPDVRTAVTPVLLMNTSLGVKLPPPLQPRQAFQKSCWVLPFTSLSVSWNRYWPARDVERADEDAAGMRRERERVHQASVQGHAQQGRRAAVREEAQADRPADRVPEDERRAEAARRERPGRPTARTAEAGRDRARSVHQHLAGRPASRRRRRPSRGRSRRRRASPGA